MKSILPDSFSAGLTFDALATCVAYPASSGWVLTALLRGPSSIDLTATAEGNQHRISASAAETAAWLPGVYAYMIRATQGADVAAVESGVITIKPDFAATVDGTDMRSPNAIVLASIEAVIAKRATQDQQRYTINNRELWRTPIADLLKLRATYRDLVRQENNAACGRSGYGRLVRIRFTTPK